MLESFDLDCALQNRNCCNALLKKFDENALQPIDCIELSIRFLAGFCNE